MEIEPDAAGVPANPLAAPPPSENIAPPTVEPASPVEPVAAPPVLPPAVLERFRFHGEAREYFRIWIVNTFLTAVTLGVFHAWAKVRKRRYLRGNTELMGHRFDYTADPRRILVGNVIVVILFLAYALFGAVYPAVRLIAVGVIVVLLPWIVVRSLAFNAYHTMWRGMRFRFHPSLSAGVMIYLLQPLLIPLTLGIYYPAWVRARNEFTIGRHRLGTAYFRFETGNGPFYGAYVVAGGMVFLAVLMLGIITGLLTALHPGHVPSTAQLLPALLLYGTIAYVAKHYVFAQLFNHIWGGTRLDHHRLRGNMRTTRWLGLQLTNLGAIIVSCGLLYPWAVIRSTRYAIECLEFQPTPAFEKIERIGGQGGSAIGETAAEFAGLDFGL